MSTPEFYFVLRLDKDGNELGTVDIPAKHLEDTLKRNPTWRVVGETSSFIPPKLAEMTPPSTKVECPLCGVEFATEAGLKVHKARAHKS